MVKNTPAHLPQGYTKRPATMADAEQVTALINRCSLETIGIADHTVEVVLMDWGFPGFDMATRTLMIFAPDGQYVAHGEVWDESEFPVNPLIFGRVHPDFTGQGLGTYLMQWCIACARDNFSRIPDDVRVSVRAFTHKNNAAALQLFKETRMTFDHHSWWMLIEFDSVPTMPKLPDGIVLHPYQHPQDARTFYRVFDEAWQDHRGYVRVKSEVGFKQWEYDLLSEEHFDPALWFKAMDGEEVAGIIIAKPYSDDDPEKGWVRIIAVRRSWRRRGIALALLQHIFGVFWSRGVCRVGLSVDASSLTGAAGVYEKAGMRIERQMRIYELELRPGRDFTTQSPDDDSI